MSFEPELYREHDAAKSGAGGLMDTNVRVRVVYPDLSEDIKVTWSLDKMDSRLVDMQELCNQLDYGGPSEGEIDYDPFAEQIENMGSTYQPIGNSYVYLDMLFYLLSVDLSDIPIIDSRGFPNGKLRVAIDSEVAGVSFEELETAKELIGQELAITVTIDQARELPENFSTNVYAEYSLPMLGADFFRTICFEGTSQNPHFRYRSTHKVVVTKEIADELMHNFLTVSVYGDISPEKKALEIRNYMSKMQESFQTSIVNASQLSVSQNIDDSATTEDLRQKILEVEKEMAKIRGNLSKKEESMARKENEFMLEGIKHVPNIKKKSKACALF